MSYSKDRQIGHESLKKEHILPIVSVAAMGSQGVVAGKIVPIVIVDTANRKDIEELVRQHEHFLSGDVDLQWAASTDEKDVMLVICFSSPIESTAILVFNVEEQGVIVEQIMTVKALYLQPGALGDRLVNTMDNDRILVEVPEMGFRKKWDEIFYNATLAKMKASGMNRSSARKTTSQYIEEVKRIAKLRSASE